MARSFAITTPADSVRLDAKGHVEVFFTVTNTTRRPIRGMARVKALVETKSEWLRIEGVTERDFASGDTQQFRVTFDRPVPPSPKAAAPLGDPTTADCFAAATGPRVVEAAKKYPFRLDVSSAQDPEEDFTEGPTVTVEIPAQGTRDPRKKFPWW